MKTYKVYMDLTLVIYQLTKFDLKEYNTAFPIVFVESSDPDGACYKAIYQLIQIILKQDNSLETATLCRRLKNDARIIKAFVP
tara:strand:+ start:53 stop:301 length:249 start_codon:yes stop_codon:yes gene_type:complete